MTTRIPIWVFMVLLCAGCGSGEKPLDLGEVKGTVTLDGQPLAKAVVAFNPEKGPSSGAITDETGKYVLVNKNGKRGAMIGKHKVEISTDLDGTNLPKNEKVPPQYNRATTLTATVAKGPNTIDFDLTSKAAAPGRRTRP
jgi:hypothetical protein